MYPKRIIRDVIVLCFLFSAVAMVNLKWNYFVLPNQDKMIDTQSNLFTICSVFAGFSFSILGLILGVFSEKMIEKLKGTTLIQRKCFHIVQSIIYFCFSGVFSLLFVLGFNIYISKLTCREELVNNILYINGIGFLLFGLIYFVLAVKDLFEIIERIYGFNKNEFVEKKQRYQLNKKELEQKRKALMQNSGDK